MSINPENMPENTESEPTLEEIRHTITEAVATLFITKHGVDNAKITFAKMNLARLGVSIEKYEHHNSEDVPVPADIIHDLVEQWIQKQGRKHEE